MILYLEGVFEVRSTHGDTHLGGEDFDNRMINFFTLVRNDTISVADMFRCLNVNQSWIKATGCLLPMPHH